MVGTRCCASRLTSRSALPGIVLTVENQAPTTTIVRVLGRATAEIAADTRLCAGPASR